jgi:mevalonate kinase
LEFLRISSDSSDRREFDCRLKTLLEMNHQLLNAIGVGHIALDHVLTIARKRGYSGKLTGAGGGGCALIYIEDEFERDNYHGLKQTLIEKGYDCYEVTIGVPGLAVHDISSFFERHLTGEEKDEDWIRLPISRICD